MEPDAPGRRAWLITAVLTAVVSVAAAVPAISASTRPAEPARRGAPARGVTRAPGPGPAPAAAARVTAASEPPARVVRARALIVIPTPSRRVTRLWVRVVDRSRWTVSAGVVLAHTRTLPTLVLRPVRAGHYPLVVFCHGFDITPMAYLHLLRHWAGAGFVVAAPYFPLTRADAGRHLDERDVDNQPHDVSMVISQVEHRLGSLVDRSHVVVAGHSDGGSTAFAVGFADRLRDRRVSALLVFSGARRPTMGRFSAPRRDLPILLVQSDRDEFNSLRSAARVWAVARRPKVFLHLHGARHLPPFSTRCPWRPVVETVTTDFLRAWTTTNAPARRAARAALDRDGTRRGLSWVTDLR